MEHTSGGWQRMQSFCTGATSCSHTLSTRSCSSLNCILPGSLRAYCQPPFAHSIVHLTHSIKHRKGWQLQKLSCFKPFSGITNGWVWNLTSEETTDTSMEDQVLQSWLLPSWVSARISRNKFLTANRMVKCQMEGRNFHLQILDLVLSWDHYPSILFVMVLIKFIYHTFINPQTQVHRSLKIYIIP